MKTTALATSLAVILTALTSSLCSAQIIGVPEASGLTPVTGTMWPNTNYPNNGQVEAQSVAIAANGNVMFSWEDDGAGIMDYGGVWTIYDKLGNLVTPETTQTNLSLVRVGSYQSVANTFLSNFRSDGSAVWGQPGGWSTSARANLFGNGLSCGKITWMIGTEVPELFGVNMNDSGLACGGTEACLDSCNDFPAWQLVDNAGNPLALGPVNGVTNLGILTFSDAEVQPAGDARPGGLEYLANGNIVIVGESRKAYDRTTRFGTLNGAGGNAVVYKIVKPSGEVVLPISLVNSDTHNRASIRSSTAVTANGFAVHYWDNAANKACVRMFDNNGTPTTGGIDLVALAGARNFDGSDGNGKGFSGNGKDAYVYVTGSSATEGPYITVLNANGTLRWSRSVADVSDPINNTVNGDVSGAIAPDGRVIAVWSGPLINAVNGKTNNTIQARLFSPCGTPLGDRFAVSEYENQTNGLMVLGSQSPSAAWRGSLVAMTWRSFSPPANPSGWNKTVGARLLTVPASAPATLALSHAGGNVTLSWSGGGTLEGAADIAGPWTSIYNCSPVTQGASSAAKYFRVKAW